MDIHFPYSNIRMKGDRYILCFICILFFYRATAQSYNLVKKIPIPTPQNVTHDLLQNIYLQTTAGDIIQYNLSGEELHRFRAPAAQKATCLQAGQSLRLFAFYKASQSFQYFDRQLNLSPSYHLPEPGKRLFFSGNAHF